MLHKQTTSPELFQVLIELMGMPELSNFRLVGGTALSLIRGHRKSVDIDLFTDEDYGTTNFKFIEAQVRNKFPIVENHEDEFPRLKALENNWGLHLIIGYKDEDLIKTDILYCDSKFLFPILEDQGIRMATVIEIATMKLDVISRGGRKRDFWDLVEILQDHSLDELLQIYHEKYPYFSIDDVKKGLTDFSVAEEMPDPICLKGRTWNNIKHSIAQATSQL